MNRKGFIDFDIEEFNWFALILGAIGGFVGLIVSAKTGSGVFIKIFSFILCTVVGYFVSAKVMDG